MKSFMSVLKTCFKILILMWLGVFFILDPIMNDWEDTGIYKTFVSRPDKSDIDELTCDGTGLNDLACKGVKGLNNLADRVNEKVEIIEASKANPDNQYDTLEECLKDDSVMVEYTTREGWCNSYYVLIAENE